MVGAKYSLFEASPCLGLKSRATEEVQQARVVPSPPHIGRELPSRYCL